MAKKTKAPSRAVHEHAAIQEAVAEIEALRQKVETNLSLAEAAITNLRTSKAGLYAVALRLRGVLEGRQTNSIVESGSSPHSRSSRELVIRHKVLRRTVPRTSRSRTKQSKVGKGKRVAPKLAQYERLPWYPQGYNY